MLTLYCNAGKAIINKKGSLKGFGTVWYYPEGITNIVSLHNVQKTHEVTYNSSQCTGFVMYKADGTSKYLCHPLRGYSSLMLRAMLHMS